MNKIEYKLFNTRDYKGWFSKTILNFYGIDTNGENRGLYFGRSIEDVILKLKRSNNCYHNRVSNILSEKHILWKIVE